MLGLEVGRILAVAHSELGLDGFCDWLPQLTVAPCPLVKQAGAGRAGGSMEIEVVVFLQGGTPVLAKL